MPDHRRAQLHGARFRLHYQGTRLCMSRMLLEECVRTVQLEGELQATKFDMMVPPSIIVRTGGWSSRIKSSAVTSLDKRLQFSNVNRERKAEVCKDTIVSS
jgi:hypothetical protein